MNKSQLIEQVRLGLGNPSATKYTNEQILDNLNKWQSMAAQVAIQANGQWEVEGEIATTDIVAGQKEYALTTDIPLMSLKRVEINLTGGINDWEVADIRDLRSMDRAISNDTTGYSPNLIDIFSNSLFFVIPPTTNIAGGIKIFYQKQALDIRDNVYFVDLEEAIGKTIHIEGLTSNKSIQMVQNTTDDLEVVDAGSLLTIKLANTTSSKNTDALIQADIRVVFPDATVSVVNWNGITGSTITIGSQISQADVHSESFLPSSCEMYLVYGAVYDYAFGYGLDEKRQAAGAKLGEFEAKIESYYASRLPAVRTVREGRKENYK